MCLVTISAGCELHLVHELKCLKSSLDYATKLQACRENTSQFACAVAKAMAAGFHSLPGRWQIYLLLIAAEGYAIMRGLARWSCANDVF